MRSCFFDIKSEAAVRLKDFHYEEPMTCLGGGRTTTHETTKSMTFRCSCGCYNPYMRETEGTLYQVVGEGTTHTFSEGRHDHQIRQEKARLVLDVAAGETADLEEESCDP